MLTESQRLLIVASVDGSVHPDQADAIAHLLAGSEEARALAFELAEDRRRLAALPRLAAPFGFAEGVDAGLPIIRLPQAASTFRRATWLPYITAAGVLVAVGAVAYQLTFRPHEPGRGVASAPTATPHSTVPRVFPSELAPFPRPTDDTPVVVTHTPPRPTEIAPPPRPAGGPSLFAAGLFREIESPAEVATRLPLLCAVGELDGPDAQARAKAVWTGLTAARLDLFTTDPAAVLPAIHDAAKSCGWVVTTEAAAQSLLKAKHPATFALYLDAVPAAEGARFLSRLAAEHRRGAKLTLAHLSTAGGADLRELKELFGSDPKPSGRFDKDDSTIGQVVKQLTSKRPALLYAVSPPVARPAVTSKEVRAFADSRTERKPGTIPLLVVIRPTDGN